MKTDMFRIWLYVAMFGIATFTLLFTSLFVFDIGTDSMIDPIHNVSMSIANLEGISQQMKDSIDADKQKWEDTEIPYDLYFVELLIFAIIISFTTAYFSATESKLSFYGYLTFGMIIFLSIITTISTIITWLTDNFIYGLFPNAIYSAPLIFAFFDKLGIWCFIWALGLLIVNQLDLEKREELQ